MMDFRIILSFIATGCILAMPTVNSLHPGVTNLGNVTCQEPNTTELSSMLALAVEDDPSLLVNAQVLFSMPLGSSAEAILRSYDYNFTTHAHRMSQCPRYFLNTMESAMEVRSLCPWRYIIHSDINRYPRDIVFVQCECEECINSKLGTFSSDLDLCRPVIHNRPVLRRTGQCIDGIHRYEHQFEPVPMACVCERSASRMSIN